MGHPGFVRRRLVLFVLAGAVLWGALQQSSTTVAAQGTDRVKVLITFATRPGPAQEAIVRAAGGQVRYTYHLVPGIAASLPAQAVDALRNNPGVLAVEADTRVEAYDAELDLTWGVNRIGAGTVQAAGVTGAGVRVAVFDSGVQYTHFELSHAFAGGWDFVNNDDDPFDDNGHGTHVSGTIAAAHDGQWVVGAAPGVELFAVKILDATGQGDFSDVIAGLQWAVDNHMQIANHSYGSASNPGTLVQQAFANASAAGLLSVAAAGNAGNCAGTGNNISYPARYSDVISVGATDEFDNRACFSSTGPDLELAAPGSDIPSSYLNNDIAIGSGTSMASPHVTGTAALLMSAGVLDPTTVRSLMTSTAQDLGVAGRDKLYGFGLVNAAAAFAATGGAAPAVYVALSPDQTAYATPTTAALTVSVTNQAGAAVSGLSPGFFTTTFDGAAVGLTFTESATPGTYTSALDISTSAPGMHSVVVDVADGGLTGTDTSAFLVGTPPPPGTVHVSSIAYSLGTGRYKNTLLITVTIADGNGAPVPNAVVDVIVYLNGAPWSIGEGATDSQGQVTFGATNAPSGTYTTQVFSVSAGALVWDGVTPANSYVK